MKTCEVHNNQCVKLQEFEDPISQLSLHLDY